MKYITEAQLRDLYKESPFESYKCSDDTRLTPNARQFLIDFKIDILDSENRGNNKKPKADKNLDTSQEKSDTDDINRIDLLIRKLSIKLRKFNPNVSIDLFNLSKGLEICKLKELEILENAKTRAEDLFMDMEITNPYLDFFIIIDDFARELSRIEISKEEKKIIGHLVAYTYSLYIKNVEGGSKN